MTQIPPHRHERIAPETLAQTTRVGRASGPATPERSSMTSVKAYAAKETAAIRTAFARSGERAVQATLTLEGNASQQRVQSVIEVVDRQRAELLQDVNKAVADLFDKIRDRRGPSKAAGETSRSGEAVTKRSRTGEEMLGGQSTTNSMISRSTQISERGVEPAVIPINRQSGYSRASVALPSPPQTPLRHQTVRRTDSNSGRTAVRKSVGPMDGNGQRVEANVSEEWGSEAPEASGTSESEESEDDQGYWVKRAPTDNRRKALLSSTYDDLDLRRESR